jgi:hypothetical protein
MSPSSRIPRAGHVKHVFTREESCARDGGALEIFPIGLSARRVAARRGASLWKLGRNWPEFNPGIQFAVVFVPGGVNPTPARGRRFPDLICVYR